MNTMIERRIEGLQEQLEPVGRLLDLVRFRVEETEKLNILLDRHLTDANDAARLALLKVRPMASKS